MAKTYEYNPHNGSWYETVDDPQTGGIYIHHKQDCQPILDFAKDLRNSGVNDKKKKGSDMRHYAFLPAWFMIECRNRGIDVNRDTKKIVDLIEKEYPLLKTSNMKHHIRASNA